jgi:DNA-binding NtrC family response regulator
MSRTLLIIDDEDAVRSSLSARLTREGYSVLDCATVTIAVERITADVDVVVLDERRSDSEAVAAIHRIRQVAPRVAIVVLTAYSTVEDTIRTMREGASYCVVKPFSLDHLSALIDAAVETSRLRCEVHTLRSLVAALHDPGALVSGDGAGFHLPVEGIRLADVERQLIREALERSSGNLSEAGRLLGLNRDQVRYRLEKFRLAKPPRNGANHRWARSPRKVSRISADVRAG